MMSGEAHQPQTRSKANLKDVAIEDLDMGFIPPDITPDMYELWQSAMLATASQHDAQWTPDVEHAWDHTLSIVVSYMINRY